MTFHLLAGVQLVCIGEKVPATSCDNVVLPRHRAPSAAAEAFVEWIGHMFAEAAGPASPAARPAAPPTARRTRMRQSGGRADILEQVPAAYDRRMSVLPIQRVLAEEPDADRASERKRGSGVQIVYDLLRDGILNLELPPGSTVDEARLAGGQTGAEAADRGRAPGVCALICMSLVDKENST